jgi:hypothetical protein
MKREHTPEDIQKIEQPWKPNCHKCVNRDPLPMTHHIQCLEPKALISGNARAAQKGWFHWPWNFDPIWLEECSAYEEKKA